uniref:Uncharacterized protein n=1 Tax=Glossina pallidipes TaxID=7398 RepID=A0A1B0AB05_GLOPL
MQVHNQQTMTIKTLIQAEVSSVIIAVAKDYSEENVANETTIAATASANIKIAQCGYTQYIRWLATRSESSTQTVSSEVSISSTVARYLSVYVLKRKRFTIELLPTPAPPNTTSRIRSKSAMFSLKQREQ